MAVSWRLEGWRVRNLGGGWHVEVDGSTEASGSEVCDSGEASGSEVGDSGAGEASGAEVDDSIPSLHNGSVCFSQ